jgi:hypothetical protein
MKKPLLVVGWFLVGLVLLFGASAHIYHSRRFRACSEELEVAVRSAKPFQAFTRDPRPDGLMKRLIIA